MHLKYIDEFTLLEAENMKTSLKQAPDRPRPYSFHPRIGHYLLKENSELYDQMWMICRLMQRRQNPCKSKDFQPQFNWVEKGS